MLADVSLFHVAARRLEAFGTRELCVRAGILAFWGLFIVLAGALLVRDEAARLMFVAFGPRTLLVRAGILAFWGPFIVLADVSLFHEAARLMFEAFGPRPLLVLADVLLVVHEAAGPVAEFGGRGLLQRPCATMF